MSWTAICALDRLRPDRGVAALVDGEPVAVFRLHDDALFAVDHVDPFTGAPVLARGLIGSLGDRPVVASPLHKQRFDLATGACVDDEAVSIRTWPIRVHDGIVEIAGTALSDRAGDA